MCCSAWFDTGASPQEGNEAVLRARFEDAQFFYEEDLQKPLAEFRPLLAGTIFQKDLGTLLDKSVCAACRTTRLACASSSRTHSCTLAQSATPSWPPGVCCCLSMICHA